MIIIPEEMTIASSVSINNGVVEFELEETLKDKYYLIGDIVFMCRFCDSIVVAVGTVEKYEEVTPDPDLEQDIFSKLYIRGYSVSFTIK